MFLLISSLASAASLTLGVETGVQTRDVVNLSAPKSREFLPAWEGLATVGMRYKTERGLVVVPTFGFGLARPASSDSFSLSELLGLELVASNVEVRFSARFEDEVFGDITEMRLVGEIKAGPRFELSDDFTLVPYGSYGVGGAKTRGDWYFTNAFGGGVGITYARHNTTLRVD